MGPNPQNNFEIQKYYQNEPRFNVFHNMWIVRTKAHLTIQLTLIALEWNTKEIKKLKETEIS